ncbi:MAG: hypothetical protein RBR53_10090 [Desulforegulaceae bacterium]|nr:hypothetical protein [Desulforegulaceae bacterium]
MKQKYLLEKQEDASLVIREYGELEEGIFSLLCEEKFDSEGLMKVLEDDDELLDFLRTDNMFPPFSYMTKIREAVREVYSEEADNHAEIIFDDVAIAKKEREEEAFFDEDELLDDILDGGDDALESVDEELGKIGTSKTIKIDEEPDLDIGV